MARRPDTQDLVRWRWRLRGAWQWPTFIALTVVEAVLLVHLPVWGDGPEGGVVAAGLLAACLNLVVVALLAPVAGILTRLRRPDLPRAIARDYAGTVLLCALLVGLVVAGLAHRGTRREEAHELAITQVAVDDWVRREQPSFTRVLPLMDSLRLEDGLWRTCLPGDEPGARPLCVFVRTTTDPAQVRPDSERVANGAYRLAGG